MAEVSSRQLLERSCRPATRGDLGQPFSFAGWRCALSRARRGSCSEWSSRQVRWPTVDRRQAVRTTVGPHLRCGQSTVPQEDVGEIIEKLEEFEQHPEALDVGEDAFDADDPYDPMEFIDDDDEFYLRSAASSGTVAPCEPCPLTLPSKSNKPSGLPFDARRRTRHIRLVRGIRRALRAARRAHPRACLVHQHGARPRVIAPRGR